LSYADTEDGATDDGSDVHGHLIKPSQASSGGKGGAGANSSGSTLVEGALSVDFALWCFVLFCGTGAGLTVINNLGSLTKALGAQADGQDVYVVILSIGNCLGRAAFGFVSDAFARYLTRPAWVSVAVLLMGIAHVILTFADLNVLYVGVALTGFAYGGFWSLGPALVADRFGMKAFAATYSLTSLFTALSSYVMSAVVASAIYQSHIVGGGTDCTAGRACFQDTFIILACMCGAATLVGMLLTYRLRSLYDEKGKPKPWQEWADEHNKQTAFVRGGQRLCLLACCCAWGRSLVVDEEDEDALREGREYGGGGTGVGGDASGVTFDGDLSLYRSKADVSVMSDGSR
jgi:hypothetical protein